MYQDRIEAYFQRNGRAMIEDIARLIRIESVNAPASPGRPFGEQNALALQKAINMASSMGLKATNWENYVAVVDLSDKPPCLDILAHLDVVPGGDGWKVTAPFQPEERQGRLYGRGAIDDKGPAVAALYAMACVQELDVPLRGNCRLILGSDEETGSQDIDYYYARNEEAPYAFSPDAEFPVINIEKGGLQTGYRAEWAEDSALPRTLSVDGGTAGNVVPGTARAVVEGLELDLLQRECARVAEKTGIQFTVTALEQPGQHSISAEGKSAHASTPWEGNSAVSGLLTLLASLPMAASPGFAAIQSLAELFPHGDYYGEAAGIALEDEISGKLTLCSNVIHYTATGVSGRIDSRLPVCATDEATLGVLRSKMEAAGLPLAADAHTYPAHHVPEDSKLVQTLLSCYERYTGEKGFCLAVGGGTYVHHLKNGVAFGCSTLGTDYHMHGADEYLIVEEIIRSAKIFAQAIIDLCS